MCVCRQRKEYEGERAQESPRVGSVSVFLNPVCVCVCVEEAEQALSASGAEGSISQDTIYGDQGTDVSGLQMPAAQYRPQK